MEIKDYLRIIGRRFWIPLLVPALAAGAAVGILWQAPDQYRARATVSLSGVGGSPQATRQMVDEFHAAIATDRVLDEAAARTGVPRSAIQNNIFTTQLGSSSILGVGFHTQAKYREQAPEVLRVAATEALRLTLHSTVEIAGHAVASAERSLEGVQAQFAEFTEETGLALVDETYSATQSELLQLRIRLEDAGAAGASGQVAYYTRAIKAREERIEALAPVLERYRALQTARDKAINHLASTREELSRATARMEATGSEAMVSVNSGARQAPPLPQLARAAVAAAGGGFVLGVLVVVMLEAAGLSGRRRRRSTSGEPVPSPAGG